MTFFVDPTNYGDRIFLGMSGTRALVFLTDDAPEGTFYFMVTAQKDGFSTEFEIALEVVRTAANNLLASPASLEEEPIEEAPPCGGGAEAGRWAVHGGPDSRRRDP